MNEEDSAYQDYIDDILNAAEKVETFTDGMEYDTFAEDTKTVDAVLRNFEVIGEAAKNVPDHVKAEHPDVPWTEMAGMRDKLIHGYATVDLEIVWETVADNIPEIRDQLETVQATIKDD